jgi:2-iminobutanoate/2-iminopropanoate deaminase
MIKKIFTSEAPAPIGPYSQAIAVRPPLGSWLFISGQIALDPATNVMVEGDIKAQTTQVLENIAAILRAAGASFAEVVKVEVFLQRLGDFNQVNDIYRRYFSADPQPARYVVEVSALPKNAVIEIAVTACLNS